MHVQILVGRNHMDNQDKRVSFCHLKEETQTGKNIYSFEINSSTKVCQQTKMIANTKICPQVIRKTTNTHGFCGVSESSVQKSTLIFTERIYGVIAESKLKITVTPYAEQLSQKVAILNLCHAQYEGMFELLNYVHTTGNSASNPLLEEMDLILNKTGAVNVFSFSLQLFSRSEL